MVNVFNVWNTFSHISILTTRVPHESKMQVKVDVPRTCHKESTFSFNIS